MRAASYIGMFICTIQLAAAGGCDCASCADEADAIDSHRAGLDGFYEETGTSADDWSWGVCVADLISSQETAQYCVRMVELCDRQQAHNDCVAERCGSQDKVEIDCT